MSCVHDGGFGTALGCAKCNGELAAMLDSRVTFRPARVKCAVEGCPNPRYEGWIVHTLCGMHALAEVDREG